MKLLEFGADARRKDASHVGFSFHDDLPRFRDFTMPTPGISARSRFNYMDECIRLVWRVEVCGSKDWRGDHGAA